MSWKLFSQTVVKKMEECNWQTPDEFPKYLATEYDKCVKKGKDLITKNSVVKGNTELMFTLLKNAQTLGLASNSSNFYDQYMKLLGNAVVGYWSGAILTNIMIPPIPAPGTLSNIQVVQNIVSNPGKWVSVPTPPITDNKKFIDTFIKLAQLHLLTIKGTCFTISQYPVPLPPGPGIINWQGYKVNQ